MGVTASRAAAYAAVRRTFEDGAYADRALLAAAAGLEPRDRALATRLAYETVQRRATLDYVLGALAKRAADEIDPPLRAAAELGLVQLLFLDGIPDHAAVTESVELAKRDHRKGAGFVNAVLRRATREGRALVDNLTDDTPAAAALKYSHPDWIAALWWDQLGPDEARALMRADNEPAEVALRVNTLMTDDPAEVAADLEVDFTMPEPDTIIVDGPFDAHGHSGHARGSYMPQSRASQAIARVVDPQHGERVLDLCAAPGGKTTHLSALMHAEGEIVAVERNPQRAQGLRDTAERMWAHNVQVVEADARDWRQDGFDRVLVDPPCSGLGTLRSRPDLRWRVTPNDVTELVEQQRAILEAGANATKPGGVLVYSTCTISPDENEHMIDRFLDDHDDFKADDLLSDGSLWEHPSVPCYAQSLPHRDGTDGFFIARLRRGPA